MYPYKSIGQAMPIREGNNHSVIIKGENKNG